MSFQTSGIEAATSGAKDVLSLQKAQQEAAVRPRELEAATSLAESRATEARSQIDMMSKLSRADADAANAIREANAVGDQGKTLAAMLKAHGEAGNLERTIAIQDKIKKNELDGYEAVIKASKATEAQNEEMSVSLRSLSDYGPSSDFGETLAKRYKEEVEANPTPEKKLKYANTVTTLNKLREYQTTGKPWSQAYKDLIEPAADSLSTSAQNHKKNLLEAANERARLKNEADIQRAELAAILKSQQIASQQENQRAGKQTIINTKTIELDQKYQTMEAKLRTELKELQTEVPTVRGKKKESDWFDSDIPNPLITAKEEQIVALRDRHDENMVGLQIAINAGKTFVPKPYSTIPEVVLKEDKVSVNGKEYKRPAGWDDAKWEAYKKSIGSK